MDGLMPFEGETEDLPRMATTGTLYGVGMGPGDPDLLTVKARRILERAPVLVHFCKQGKRGNARGIADAILRDPSREMALAYPYTTELHPEHPDYVSALATFYDEARTSSPPISARPGCGDPVRRRSLLLRVVHAPVAAPERSLPVDVVPGVTGMSGCWTRAGTPITWGDDVLTVLPATLSFDTLVERLRGTDAAVVMKLGRHCRRCARR